MNSEPFGHYFLHKKIAHGGMAEIYLASTSKLLQNNEPVVIKRMLPELSHDPRFVAMFLNEAQLAANMNHPNIVHAIDFGEVNGQLYIAMEYVDGLDCWRFASHTDADDVARVSIAVHVALEVLNALSYAHNYRDVNGEPIHVVHRDLSPSNIYLSQTGNVKLGDFGIAQIESARYRAVKAIPKGKFGYMAPEQVDGKRVTPRADIYSVGIVLAEMLIRRQIFTGTSQLSVARDIREGRMEALEQNAEMIPSGIQDILETALARNEDDRFLNAKEFAMSLEAYASSAQKWIEVEQFANYVKTAIDNYRNSGNSQSPMDLFANSVAGGELLALQQRSEDTNGTPRTLDSDFPLNDGTPVTLDFEQKTGNDRYWARLDEESSIGPTTFAHVLELIYGDKISPGTAISKDGLVFNAAREYEELVRHLPVATPTQSHEDLQGPSRKGFFSVDSPSNLLVTLSSKDDTGLLICDKNGVKKEIYFKEGTIVYVGTTDSGDLLGEYLVKKDVISRTELEMALALLPKFQGHLGDTLIALGIMTAVELFEHINSQIESRLKDVLQWTEGEYEFFSGASTRKGVLEVQMNAVNHVRDYLLAKAGQLDTADYLSQISDFQVSPAKNFEQIIARFHLPYAIEHSLRSISTWNPVARLPFYNTSDTIQTFKTIFLAIESGIWICSESPPPWR